jgi:hypothetical protein
MPINPEVFDRVNEMLREAGNGLKILQTLPEFS